MRDLQRQRSDVLRAADPNGVQRVYTMEPSAYYIYYSVQGASSQLKIWSKAGVLYTCQCRLHGGNSPLGIRASILDQFFGFGATTLIRVSSCDM